MVRKISHISGIVIFPGNSLILSTCKYSLICYRTPPIGWCLPWADTKSCSQPHKNATLLTSCKQTSLLSRHIFRSQGHLLTGGSTVLWMLFLGYCWTKMTKENTFYVLELMAVNSQLISHIRLVLFQLLPSAYALTAKNVLAFFDIIFPV